MTIEEIYTYILTAFEGKSFENIILNKENTDLKQSFDSEYREKMIEEFSTDKYTNIIEQLAKSCLSNISKGANGRKPTKKQCEEILIIYQELLQSVSDYSKSYEMIAIEHFNKIRGFIESFMNSNDEEHNQNGYSAELLLQVLGIKENELKGKALDIGCGKTGDFVKFLRNNNVDAYGIDIDCEDSDYLEQEDWLQKEYEENAYDLITAHLTFSKHFVNCNASEEDSEEHIEYAKAYMKILNSLKIGGKWHYVPAITFIEEFLPEDKYMVENNFVNRDIMRTIITKLG